MRWLSEEHRCTRTDLRHQMTPTLNEEEVFIEIFAKPVGWSGNVRDSIEIQKIYTTVADLQRQLD